MTDAQRERQWRTESDARTLKEAGLITGDKQRLKDAQALLKKEQEAISKVVSQSKSTPNSKAKKPAQSKSKKK